MSVLLSDLRLYFGASAPEADGATVGGAINFNLRPEFEGTAISPTTLLDAVSESISDTATKIIYNCRDGTGLVQSETLTLTGQTKVAGTKNCERLLSALASGAPSVFGLTTPGGTQAVGTIALMAHTLTISAHTARAGSANATASAPPLFFLATGDGASVSPGMVLRTTGGTGPNQIRRILAVNPGGAGADVVAVDRNWGTTPDATTTYEVAHGFVFELGASNGGVLLGTATQTLGISRMFVGATANVGGGANITFYEEIFVNNNNQTTALTAGSVLIQAIAPALPGTDTIEIALANVLNDTSTIANRQTAPASGFTAFTAGAPPQSVSIPAPGNLPASTAAGNAAGAQKIAVALLAVAGSASYEGVPTIRTTGSST